MDDIEFEINNLILSKLLSVVKTLNTKEAIFISSRLFSTIAVMAEMDKVDYLTLSDKMFEATTKCLKQRQNILMRIQNEPLRES
jgi:hypothetical protein